MTALQKTTAIIAACMAESILMQVKQHIPGLTSQRLRWFDGAFAKYSHWLNDGRPISAATRKALDKFDDKFIAAAQAVKSPALSPAVQSMLLVEATNTLLHDIPACCPGASQAEAWQSVRKHHNAIIDGARAKMAAEEIELFEELGNQIYEAVTDFLRPGNQDVLMLGVGFVVQR